VGDRQPEDPDEVARTEAAYEALVAAYDELGYPIGRTSTDRQEWAMQRLPEFRRLTSDMKSALDPKGSIAPGKYGIA
jgi:4-cresol dehydrogenase (hydroxylating)